MCDSANSPPPSVSIWPLAKVTTDYFVGKFLCELDPVAERSIHLEARRFGRLANHQKREAPYPL
jgi:hypothetical protein